MFKTKLFRTIITLGLITVCSIAPFILKASIRGNLSAPFGGELFIVFIPLIVYFAIKNWKFFMDTCFPKDTTFDDYFNEYFTGKDMIEDTPSNSTDHEDFITN